MDNQSINLQEPTGQTPASSPTQTVLPQAPQQPGDDTSGLDQSVVALMHGIKQQESGGDYTKLGDKNNEGQYTAGGVGQWSNQVNGIPQALQDGEIPANFSGDAKQYGLDPTDFSPANQNKVMYAVIAADKKAGLTPEQIASKWNSGDPNKYLTETTNKTGSVGTYNVANYVKSVMSYAQQYARQNNSSAEGLPQAPQAPQQQTNQTMDENQSVQNTQPEGLGQKALDVARGVGNFLFPIVGDVYNDVTGQNKKTTLQQIGDAALSALPFIPGLGEAGEGAEAAVEGGEAAAKSGGVLSKILGSTVAKGAGVGYGAGVASNLSQGQGLGQAFTPNITNIGGAVLGGATPLVLKGLSSTISKLAGIDPQVANELGRMATNPNPEDVSLMEKYNQAAVSHASNVRTPSVENLAADNLDAAAQKISENTQAAGQAVGAAKQAASVVPLNDASKVADTFAQEVKNRFGLEIASDPEGKIIITPTSGSMRTVSPTDVSRIQAVAQQLNQLGNGATAGNAIDVIANIDDDLNFNKNAYGQSVSPVDGLLSKTRSSLDGILRQSAPDLAEANDRFSGLKGLQEDIRQIAGNKLQRGELLMQRIFSNKSADSLALFDKINQETGIDLTKHAVLAKNAIDNFGSNADKSLLAQMLGEASKGSEGIVGTLMKGGKYVAQKTIANPTKISKGILEGTPGILSRLSPFLTKGAIESARGLKSQ